MTSSLHHHNVLFRIGYQCLMVLLILVLSMLMAWENKGSFQNLFRKCYFLEFKFETNKSRHTNWEPNWDIKENIKRNQNHYTVGTLADRQFYWPKFMGGWVSIGEIMDNSFVDG